jgi:SAM-dependent methyltransferase
MTQRSATPIPLIGFDDVAEVFRDGDRVLRGIYPAAAPLYRQVLERVETHGLFEHGIVRTRAASATEYPEPGFGLLLEHERIPFVSYPHEWPASMLLDAAQFHLRLFQELGRSGLTLKDWHPYNILFRGTRPYFVDFTSLIPTERLLTEPYLEPAVAPPLLRRGNDPMAVRLWALHDWMYERYFLLPLYLMAAGRTELARRRMAETALNAGGGAMRKREVLRASPVTALQLQLRRWRKQAALRGSVVEPARFFAAVSDELAALSVRPLQSGYATYYEDKHEAFSLETSAGWPAKQRTIGRILDRMSPATLLDLGSNTGWFSILAAKRGTEVVAVDIDEACAEILYLRAKQAGLPIQVVVVDIAAQQPPVYPRPLPHEPARQLSRTATPLFSRLQERVRCDLVLGLAISHHLVLGHGKTFDALVQMLSPLVGKGLVIEFIALNDHVVRTQPSFFPAFAAKPGAFEWYTLDNFVAAFRREFRSVEMLPSHPDTRHILVCQR